jgi:site-specific recombinase XerD
MNTTPTRIPEQAETQAETQADGWPRKVKPGRAIVTVYRRKTPSGNFAFMVANYADGERRRFDSYADEAEAIKAAETLANRLDKRDYVAASMTKDQAIEYANSVERLKPFNLTVDAATATVAACLKVVPDLSNFHAAVKLYAARHKKVTKKAVAHVVVEFLKVKKSRKASERYMADLDGRLNRFANNCKRDACNVTTADVQDWLDGLKLAPQSYRNYRTVLGTLFEFAVARGYAVDNPVEGVEKLKIRNGDVEIFTPVEIARLLEAARANHPDYLPCLAIGAFAGLRSAEIERLEWSDIHLAERFIVVSADNAKTASRRIVPLHDNLGAWLAPYAERNGKVWRLGNEVFYKRQQSIAAATAVEADAEKGIKAEKATEWKANALRHSYASYRFAQTNDAGRVAGECGNSAAVIHGHYRELVKPVDAERWFNVKPETPANVLAMPSAITSA